MSWITWVLINFIKGLQRHSKMFFNLDEQSNNLLDEAANAEKAGLVEVRVKHSSYDFNTLNEMAQMKH